jgi:hypothetical protein
MELNTAVKPFMLLKLLKRGGEVEVQIDRAG